MNAVNSAKSEPMKCLQCGADVVQTPGPGRVKRFCTPWHGRLFRRATGYERL
ncbi:hypothetical protein OG883_35735 [Streptomyces sp. NBC_01142]|uniref:hypothetical protein n=1 Tax=Streptomyces sp. NBC_01142 TaxID=2975865 RepID=UPI0022520C9E|nr:hypothetical protein [Streptomyces sp. NBC_01142]MCX4825123.1 hypothetical protein [Streptomyces sp. NBC_01142]